MNDELMLRWAAMAPGLSIPEWAEFMYVDRTTVSRRVSKFLEVSHVVRREEGYLLRPRDRFYLWTDGLKSLFPKQHTHPVAGYHVHNSDGDTDGDIDDGHSHPGYFNGYAGVLTLCEWVELREISYAVAPGLLQGEGTKWTFDGRPRRILEWRWLRNSSFLRGIAIYEDDFKVGFLNLGRSLTPEMVRQGWENRFPKHRSENRKLILSSYVDQQFDGAAWLDTGPDPDIDLNPQLSGFVISGDYRGIEIAQEILPRGDAHVYVEGRLNTAPLYRGTAYPAPYDDVANSFQDVDLERLDGLHIWAGS